MLHESRIDTHSLLAFQRHLHSEKYLHGQKEKIEIFAVQEYPLQTSVFPTDRKVGRCYNSSPFSEKTKVSRKIANVYIKDEQKK